MTVSTTTQFAQHAAAGGTVFAFNFKILAEADLVVKTTNNTTGAETTATLGVDYTVSAGPWPSGGTVTFSSAPTSGHIVTIYNDPDPVQDVDLAAGGTLPAESVEAMMDRIVLLVQRSRDLIARAAKLPDGSTLSDISLPFPLANNLIGWNSSATELENKVVADLTSTVVSAYIATLLDDSSATEARATLGVDAAAQAQTHTSAVAGGTVNAITASFSPAIAALADRLRVCVTAAGANTSTTPTFTPNSGTIAAKTIVKWSDTALLLGDIPGADYPLDLQFDASLDKWVLLNPALGGKTPTVQVLTGSGTWTKPVGCRAIIVEVQGAGGGGGIGSAPAGEMSAGGGGGGGGFSKKTYSVTGVTAAAYSVATGGASAAAGSGPTTWDDTASGGSTTISASAGSGGGTSSSAGWSTSAGGAGGAALGGDINIQGDAGADALCAGATYGYVANAGDGGRSMYSRSGNGSNGNSSSAKNNGGDATTGYGGGGGGAVKGGAAAAGAATGGAGGNGLIIVTEFY